jgi:CAAX protease family protein
VTRARRAATAELVAIGCIAAWNVGRNHLARRARIPANVAAAAALVGIARVAGVRGAELGLDPARLGRGVREGLLAATPLAAATAAVLGVPQTRRLLADEEITATSPGEAVFETLVRIPIETALAEEVAFRGVLLALGLRARPRGWAVAMSSLCFGLWHVRPNRGPVARHAGANGAPASTIGEVVVTGVAGAGLAWLRLRSESLAAPIVAHAAVNMVAFAGLRATQTGGAG